MTTAHLNRLMTALADGSKQHITALSQAAGMPPPQLNSLWQQTPAHIRGLLRQKDGFWHLVRPLAMLPENYQHSAFKVTVLQETESTNTVLLQAAKNGENIHRRVIAAHSQTKGRGRQGKSWHGKSGECLMFSIGWTFPQNQARLGALALVAALFCQQALAAQGCPVQIKWPNDLVHGLNKLGGILIETVQRNGQTHAVIGIGINFVLPKNTDNAAALQTLFPQHHTAADITHAILQQADSVLSRFAEQGFAPFQAAYEAVHRDSGMDICLLRDGEIYGGGTVAGINADGSLRLKTEHGEQNIVSGETSLRRPEQLVSTQALPQQHLLLDGGNSRIKWAWIEEGRIMRTGHAPYRDLSPLAQDWQQYGGKHIKITGSAVCGIAKQEAVQQQISNPIEWLGSMPRALGVTNHYRNPGEHGADRWFNALGSRRFSKNACIIVSCGTAVTVDALTADNHYLGGSILPGFHLMRESLVQKTARLNRAEGHCYPFPTTTANALSTGIMDAVCGAVILMYNRLQARCDGHVPDLIITGGGAAKVAAALPETFALDKQIKIIDNLVIYGLLEWIGSHNATEGKA